VKEDFYLDHILGRLGRLGSISAFLHFFFTGDLNGAVLKTPYSFDDLDRLTSIEYRKASNNNMELGVTLSLLTHFLC
jgi:hypothetical protein